MRSNTDCKHQFNIKEILWADRLKKDHNVCLRYDLICFQVPLSLHAESFFALSWSELELIHLEHKSRLLLFLYVLNSTSYICRACFVRNSTSILLINMLFNTACLPLCYKTWVKALSLIYVQSCFKLCQMLLPTYSHACFALALLIGSTSTRGQYRIMYVYFWVLMSCIYYSKHGNVGRDQNNINSH